MGNRIVRFTHGAAIAKEEPTSTDEALTQLPQTPPPSRRMYGLCYHVDLLQHAMAFLDTVDQIPIQVACLEAQRMSLFHALASYRGVSIDNSTPTFSSLMGAALLNCALQYECFVAAEWLTTVGNEMVPKDAVPLLMYRRQWKTIEWLCRHPLAKFTRLQLLKCAMEMLEDGVELIHQLPFTPNDVSDNWILKLVSRAGELKKFKMVAYFVQYAITHKLIVSRKKTFRFRFRFVDAWKSSVDGQLLLLCWESYWIDGEATVARYWACAGGLTHAIVDDDDPERCQLYQRGIVHIAIQSKRIELLDRLLVDTSYQYDWEHAYADAAMTSGSVFVLQWLEAHSSHFQLDSVDQTQRLALALEMASHYGNLEVFQWILPRVLALLPPLEPHEPEPLEREADNSSPRNVTEDLNDLVDPVERALVIAFSSVQPRILEWYFGTFAPERIQDETLRLQVEALFARFGNPDDLYELRSMLPESDEEPEEGAKAPDKLERELAFTKWMAATLPNLLQRGGEWLSYMAINCHEVALLQCLLDAGVATWDNDTFPWQFLAAYDHLEMIQLALMHWERCAIDQQPLDWNLVLRQMAKAESSVAFGLVWKQIQDRGVCVDWKPRGLVNCTGQDVTPFVEYFLDHDLTHDRESPKSINTVFSYMKNTWERNARLQMEIARPTYVDFLSARACHPAIASMEIDEQDVCDAAKGGELVILKKLYETPVHRAIVINKNTMLAALSGRQDHVVQWLLSRPECLLTDHEYVESLLPMALQMNSVRILEIVLLKQPEALCMVDKAFQHPYDTSCRRQLHKEVLAPLLRKKINLLVLTPLRYGSVDVLEFLIKQHMLRRNQPILHAHHSAWKYVVAHGDVHILMLLHRYKMLPQSDERAFWQRLANEAAIANQLGVLQWLYTQSGIKSARCSAMTLHHVKARGFTRVLEWMQVHDSQPQV